MVLSSIVILYALIYAPTHFSSIFRLFFLQGRETSNSALSAFPEPVLHLTSRPVLARLFHAHRSYTFCSLLFALSAVPDIITHSCRPSASLPSLLQNQNHHTVCGYIPSPFPSYPSPLSISVKRDRIIPAKQVLDAAPTTLEWTEITFLSNRARILHFPYFLRLRNSPIFIDQKLSLHSFSLSSHIPPSAFIFYLLPHLQLRLQLPSPT